MTFRPVEPLDASLAGRLAPAVVPPPPKISWIPLELLVIDETFQRTLSGKSVRLIRQMAQAWDWARFKPLSVSPLDDGRYSVLDGQHEAIGAATTRLIEALPCLILPLADRAAMASAFVGINHSRLGLTPFALFRGRVAAGDEIAQAVQAALDETGAQLYETFRYDQDYAPGAVACIRTLELIARRGGKDRLVAVLRIAVDGGVGPVPGNLLKGLELLLTEASAPPASAFVSILEEEDVDTLADAAREWMRMREGGDTTRAWAETIRTRLPRRLQAA